VVGGIELPSKQVFGLVLGPLEVVLTVQRKARQRSGRSWQFSEGKEAAFADLPRPPAFPKDAALPVTPALPP